MVASEMNGADGASLTFFTKGDSQYEARKIPSLHVSGNTFAISMTDVIKLGELNLPEGALLYFQIPSHIPTLTERRTGPIFTLADEKIALYPEAHTATVDDTPLALTYSEYRMLSILAQSPDSILDREQLSRAAWGDKNFMNERRTNQNIYALRSKIGKINEALGNAEIGAIRTVRKMGYVGMSSLMVA